VGDCYYFSCTMIATQPPALAVTLTPQANDYQYLWEYRRSGAWLPAFCLDSTENFTRLGQIILGPSSDAVFDSHAINGVTGFWFRLRITAKGTATPTLSKITSRQQTGITDCKFNEKYSADIAVTTEAGAAIPGATVTLTDRLGTVTTLIADGGGLVSTDLLASMTTLDAYAPDADYNYKQTIYSPYTLTVSAPGYDTYEAVISSLEKPIDQAIALVESLPAPTCYFEVTDDMGEPLAGATVAVYSGETLVHTLTTNGAGETTAIAVDPINPFDVLVTAEGYAQHSVKAELLNASKLTMSLDLLPPNPTYQFKVIDSDGEPVIGASVTVLDDEGTVLHELTTDDEGATIPFDVATLPEFVVVVTATGFTEYRATIEIAAEDTAITLGVATAPPTPVPVRAKVLELKSWL
jgi:hypothetical protein